MERDEMSTLHGASEAGTMAGETPRSANPSRRQFLVGAGRAALGAAFTTGLAWIDAASSPKAAWSQPMRSALPPGGPNWDQLERHLRGRLLRPDSRGYDKAIMIRNIRYAAVRPAGVAMVAGPQDIATAIAWALDNQVEMVTRSGGHSFAGYSTTPGLVIDLNGMTRVTVSWGARTLTTVGAATNEDVAAAGQPVGLGLPGGQCPTVGIPGFTLGGGLGFYMREHGLAIDVLTETKMVTAAGKLLTISEKEHPDLFWALRGGGGGNFGINTSFTFRGFRVPGQVTIFSLTWVADDCIAAFLAFQEVLFQAPDTLGAVAHFSAELEAGSVVPTLRVFGQFVDTKEATERLLSPVIAAARPETQQIEQMTFWNAKKWLAGDVGAPNAFAERSRFYPNPMPEEGAQALVDFLAKAPLNENSHFSGESAFFAWGGAVSRVPPTATAFAHRDDIWLQSFDVSWALGDSQPEVDHLIAWQNDFYDAMGAYGSDRAYQNFVDPLLQDPLTAYYAENLPRLIGVKRTYDPDNVFHFAQSIRT
jgi:FAD/FMN-containing dehydrogenase